MSRGTSARAFLDGVRLAWSTAMQNPVQHNSAVDLAEQLQAARSTLDSLDHDPGGYAAGLRDGVSVIVATYRGRDHIERCLRSLAAQTLAPDLFEVIVVPNGEPDGTVDLVRRFRAGHPAVTIRIVEQRRAGNSLARNAGAAAAEFTHLCWVDDDDEVSPGYLRALLDAVADGVVPVAHLVDIEPDGRRGTDNPISASLLDHAGQERVPPEALYMPMVFDACKLLPTRLVREVGYDASLTSGQDVLFNASLLARWPYTFRVIGKNEDAVYYRHVRPGSLSRQTLDFDFAVRDRLQVIEGLDALLPRLDGTSHAVVRQLIRGQAGFTARYVAQQPQDRDRVAAEIASRRLTSFPYDLLGLDARTLVISYCFPPYADTAGVVMAKRIRAAGQLCDVVSNDMSAVRGRDDGIAPITGPLVVRHLELTAPPTFADWRGIGTFCSQGISRIWRGRYDRVYSRAMWPASHFLAALYVARNPDVSWSAEFSDPVRFDVSGNARQAPVEDGSLLDELRRALTRRGFTAPVDGNLYTWCEALPFALADEIVFTNAHQRDFMIDRCPPDLVDRVRTVAVVREQPTLPPEFYEMRHPNLELDPAYTHIGYFGTFYATRGLGEVLDALEAYARTHGDLVRLHVFTSKPEELRKQLAGRPAADMVIATGYVPYLDFLALTTRFDALLVNDAQGTTAHGINPYLPSKWSDYHGSGTPVWGIVEPGSVLSTKPLDVISAVGDAEEAEAALATIVEGRRLAAA